MILRHIDALVGDSLVHKRNVNLHITGTKFSKINSATGLIDCQGLVAIPGLINAHTHIGDSVAKDLGARKDAQWRIHPVHGAKRKILESTSPSKLVRYMRNTVKSMIQSGTTTFVDFREGGINGISLLRRAIIKQPIRSIILGRLECYDSPSRIRTNAKPAAQRNARLVELTRQCDGIGISGANENSDASLRQYSHSLGIRAIHTAETKKGEIFSRRTTRRSEVARALLAKPHFVIHMTRATYAQMRNVAYHTRGVVVCPRANASLAEGAPDISGLWRAGCNVALGTDNVMLNSPDMFSEMDYAWKTTMAHTHALVDPRDILRMATSNAAKMLRRNIGRISSGMNADLVVIDMSDIDIEPSHDVYAALVGRTTRRAIRAVIIGGRVVYGKL